MLRTLRSVARSPGSSGRGPRAAGRRNTRATPATVTAAQGSAIDRRNAEPLTWVPESTSRFVKLLPGSSSDAAFERKTQP